MFLELELIEELSIKMSIKQITLRILNYCNINQIKITTIFSSKTKLKKSRIFNNLKETLKVFLKEVYIVYLRNHPEGKAIKIQKNLKIIIC